MGLGRLPSCFGGRRRDEGEDWDPELDVRHGAPGSSGAVVPVGDFIRHADRQARGSHLFKDDRVLTRPAAKDKLKKIINVKKSGDSKGVDDGPDYEFLALAKIYSEVDATRDLELAGRSRESLSHLLPFIINALLYGFGDHNLACGSAGSSGRYAKKNSALKVRSTASDPRELSLNGTSHLVKAQCEKQLEAFLHEQSMRSVYFALDCAWYLTTSLFTGPQSAYHRTMTLLLSMESVVTNFAAPGDLFHNADLRQGDSGTSSIGANAGYGSGNITDIAVSKSERKSVREITLDTTGNGEADLKIAFSDMKVADEARLRQWLDARSERSNMFHAELDFIKCLTDISAGLFEIDREHRRDVLRRELEKLNSFIPKNVYIPTERRKHRILRIVPEAAHVFSTKERVPYLLVLEVEDIETADSATAADAPCYKSGAARRTSIGGMADAAVTASSTLTGTAALHISSNQGPSLSQGDVGTIVEPTPNLPEDKFDFSPEMSTTVDVPEAEPSSAGAGVLITRSSSFRVETEFVDDRRPPDEDLIKALGEPWEVKSERLRLASPFGDNRNWRLISCIVKARDQLRQEMFAQRLIQEFAHMFDNSKLPLWLHPYKIIATSHDSGLIETIVDAKSIDSIKKDSPGSVVTLQDYFIGRFGGRGSSGYKKAVKNFVQSMAGYSVVSYLLNIKDRHNGNIMIDTEGHIIHIDFGFLLSNSPGGNMEFERSPFKLTKEMVQVMGGPQSAAWKLFRKLSIQGYLEACQHANKIMLMVDIAYPGNEKMPCFLQGRDYVLTNLKDRFGVDLSRKERATRMARLIDTAHGNWTTRMFDSYQSVTLSIAK
jgi:Phosphatidylinositol 3- and 4-kinase